MAGSRIGCGLISTYTVAPRSARCGHGVAEADRLAQVAHPVGGVQLGAVRRARPPSSRAGSRRRAGPRSPRPASSSSRSASICGLCEATSTLTWRQKTPRASSALSDRRQGLRVAGDHGGARAVAHRHGHPVARGRRAPPAASATESSTEAIAPCPATRLSSRLRRQITAARVLEAERAGDVRRGDLAHAVADDVVGLDAPGPQQRAQRDLHRAQHRLDDVDRRPDVSSPSARSAASISDQPASARIAASQRVSASRKTGAAARSSRPMPSHCEPWPGKTKTTGAGARPPARRGGARQRPGLAGRVRAQALGQLVG